MRNVAVLCAQPGSVYFNIPGCKVYTHRENAWTFRGGMPVIAHPPCRTWSRYCAHQAKPAIYERELGLFAAEQVKKCGGILEQPAGSGLFEAAGIPEPPAHLYLERWIVISIWQAWWNYPMRKATWLFIVGVPLNKIQIPFRLHAAGRDKRTWQLMPKAQRSATTLEFGKWLVDLASQSKVERVCTAVT